MINNPSMFHYTPLVMVIVSMSLMLGSHFFLILPSLLMLSIAFSFLLSSYGLTWVGLVIVMVYIGGMMILFTYFLSLSESRPLMFKYSLMMVPVLVASWDLIPYMDMTVSPVSMFNTFLSHIFVFSVSWLFLAMIVVVKITVFNHGPLRIYGH